MLLLPASLESDLSLPLSPGSGASHPHQLRVPVPGWPIIHQELPPLQGNPASRASPSPLFLLFTLPHFCFFAREASLEERPSQHTALACMPR